MKKLLFVMNLLFASRKEDLSDKPQFKIDAFQLFIFLLLCKLLGPLKSESWTMITLPIWFFILDRIISVPYDYIKRKWKTRNVKYESFEDFQKKLEDLRNGRSDKPMKFNK